MTTVTVMTAADHTMAVGWLVILLAIAIVLLILARVWMRR